MADSAEPLDRMTHSTDALADHQLGLLGAETLAQCRRADDVGKQRGDEPEFVITGTCRRGRESRGEGGAAGLDRLTLDLEGHAAKLDEVACAQRPRPLEPLAHHEDDLGLDARVDQPVLGNRVAGRQHHGVGEPGDEREVHPHPLLLGPAGQAQLDADQLLAALESLGEVAVLDLVPGVEVEPGPLVGERLALAALVLAAQQLGGDGLDVPATLGGDAGRSLGGHQRTPIPARSPSSTRWLFSSASWRAMSMIMSSWPPT